MRELAAPRKQWLAILQELNEQFSGEYEYFHRAGTAGIQRMTNLPEARAAEANQREYSEPVQWLGDEARKREFVDCLQSRGASVLQGGRFLAVSGDCDKGRALAWLRQVYQYAKPEQQVRDLAIGDSGNDCAMLEEAGSALLIRSPVHEFPTLQRADGVMYSTDFGPAGWAEGVARWLHGYQT